MKRQHETVRLNNLELLIAEAGSAAALARRAGTSESYLSQVRNQITTQKGTQRGIGNDLAMKIERAMGMPNGWMDHRIRTFGNARIPPVTKPTPAGSFAVYIR